MDIARYQRDAHRLDDNKRMSVSVLGLVGEAGGVQTALKKRLLTKRPLRIPKDEIQEELGDYLWYLASVCSLSPVAIGLNQLALSVVGVAAPGGRNMKFGELQQTLKGKNRARRADAVQTLARVAVEIQQLTALQTLARMRSAPITLPQLTDLAQLATEALTALVDAATGFGLSLDTIATENLKKVRSLYDDGTVHRFDTGCLPDECFPRKFTVQFSEEITASGKSRVRIKINDVIVGDTLTDNVNGDDGYRFHDAFHLAFAAVLGWSPVTRALLRRKRKSKPAVDENEDGARAIIIEEAISLFLFQRRNKFASYKERKQISFGLLNTVRELAKDLEVNVCTAKEWQTAIHQGYEAFRKLKKNRGGLVTVDMDGRSVTYSPKSP